MFLVYAPIAGGGFGGLGREMTCIPVREASPALSSRWSSLADEHFVSVCTRRRGPGLVAPQLHSEVLAAAHLVALDRHWHVRVATVMPQHVHLLVGLGAQADLPLVVDEFKGRLDSCLEKAGMSWESGYCDRRLPPGEDHLPAFRFVWQSPVRERLVAAAEAWSGFYCAEDDWLWFAPLSHATGPVPPWLEYWQLYAVDPAPA